MTIQEKEKLAELSQDLRDHCVSQAITDKKVNDNLEALMPLTSLIPTLEQIIQDHNTSVAMNERFAAWARVVITIGGIIAAIFILVQLIFRLEK